MEKQDFVSKAHRKKLYLKSMPRHIQRSNAGKFVICFRVEHVFADQKITDRAVYLHCRDHPRLL